LKIFELYLLLKAGLGWSLWFLSFGQAFNSQIKMSRN